MSRLRKELWSSGISRIRNTAKYIKGIFTCFRSSFLYSKCSYANNYIIKSRIYQPHMASCFIFSNRTTSLIGSTEGGAKRNFTACFLQVADEATEVTEAVFAAETTAVGMEATFVLEAPSFSSQVHATDYFHCCSRYSFYFQSMSACFSYFSIHLSELNCMCRSEYF